LIFFKDSFGMILMSALKHVKLYDTLSLPDASEDVVSEATLRLNMSMLYFFVLMCKNYKKKWRCSTKNEIC